MHRDVMEESIDINDHDDGIWYWVNELIVDEMWAW